MPKPSNSEIFSINKQGWVLYYVDYCGYCKNIKKDLGPIKWAFMEKVECTKNKCPVDIKSYPTWKNSITGQLWDGYGVFR
jgi:hypothetical protein